MELQKTTISPLRWLRRQTIKVLSHHAGCLVLRSRLEIVHGKLPIPLTPPPWLWPATCGIWSTYPCFESTVLYQSRWSRYPHHPLRQRPFPSRKYKPPTSLNTYMSTCSTKSDHQLLRQYRNLGYWLQYFPSTLAHHNTYTRLSIRKHFPQVLYFMAIAL